MLRVLTWLAAVSLGGLLVLVGFSLQPSLAQAPTTVVLTGARVIDGTGRAGHCQVERASGTVGG